MATIKASVGKGGVNQAEDVQAVRDLLLRHRSWLDGKPVAATGGYDDALGEAIKAFQANAAALKFPDGRIDPGGFTLRRLEMQRIPEPAHQVFAKLCWARGGGLTSADYAAAATTLGCEAKAIQAVAEVEVSSRGAFEQIEGRPTILYERHYFRRLTANRFDRTHPDISGPQGGYGRFSEQYPKLYRAALLDEPAALKSASWGAFQIMGANHQAAGHDTVEGFVDAMNGNVRKHLDAFAAFIIANPTAHTAIKNKDWTAFARAYNGPNYAANAYDTKMANAYRGLGGTN